MHRIAYFITPHGFSHAARASAIMDAVSETAPVLYIRIWSTLMMPWLERPVTVPLPKSIRPECPLDMCLDQIFAKQTNWLHLSKKR